MQNAWRVFIPVIVAVLVAGLGSSDRVMAHSSGTEIASNETGPFLVGFRILPLQPLVGQLHVTVTIDSRSTGDPVTDARVRITARPQFDDVKAQFSPGLAIPTSPRFFDANFTIDDGGIWDMEVEVTSAGETVSTIVPVSVAARVRAEGTGDAGIAFVVASLGIAGIAGWVVFTARRNIKRRNSQNSISSGNSK